MPKNSIFRFDGAKVLTISTRAELFLKKCYVCVHILNISQENTAYCTKKLRPDVGAQLLLFANSRRLESELVTQREHEHTVVALLVTIVILKCVCQTPVVTSV